MIFIIVYTSINFAGKLRKLINYSPHSYRPMAGYFVCRSEGRVPNGIFDPWVRWDGGLDSARNSSAAVAVIGPIIHTATNYPHRHLYIIYKIIYKYK